MATKRKGQVVVGTLVTPTTYKNFPIVDSNDIRGGRWIVETIQERNNIPAAHRVAGQTVYVQETDTEYKLLPDFPTLAPLTDYNWEIYNKGSNGDTTEDEEIVHQKVEEIEYANKTHYNKLVDKLSAIDDEMSLKLTQHNTVEEIQYGTPYGGFDNLYDHIKNLTVHVNNIRNNAAVYLENINYQNLPVDGHAHKENLADEIENIYSEMNDPERIMITNQGQRASIKTRIVNAENKLSSLDTRDIATILPQGSEGEAPLLSDKLDMIDAMISDIVSNTANIAVNKTIEDFNYSETPQGHQSNLKQELIYIYNQLASLSNQIDNANDIVLDTKEVEGETVNVTLDDTLTEIKQSINNLSDNLFIENIKYQSTPSGHEGTLSGEINKLYSDINTINGTISNMNDPEHITIQNQDLSTETLAAKISTLQNSINSISVTATDIAVPNHTNLATFASDYDTHVTTYDNFINNFERYLLFSTTSPDIGPIAGQEYLITEASKITKVSLYVDYEATLATNLTIKLQVATTSSGYTDVDNFNLATNATNKAVTSIPSTPISLAVDSRVRIYITSNNSDSIINSFNVCLTVVKA